MKQQLGLLDPRHPKASFAAKPADENKAVGAAAFAKFAGSTKLQHDEPAADQATDSAVDDIAALEAPPKMPVMEASAQPAAPVATAASASLLSQKRAQFSSMFATENKATVEAAAAAPEAAMPSFTQKKHKEVIDMDPNGCLSSPMTRWSSGL